MAALIPILLPIIVDTGVNIASSAYLTARSWHIENALQGDSSSVSFQIGKKVFTNKKPFNFGSLPSELRRKIILLAMEASKDLILPTPYFFDPTQPLTVDQIKEIQRRHFLHPESKHYRSHVGDRQSANGYPISTWRWTNVNSEWREVVQPGLWRDLEVLGYRPYTHLIKHMDSKDGFGVLRHTQSITLREGFRSPSDIYQILSDPYLTSLTSISILPDYPTSFDQLVAPVPTFPFGLQLIRTPKPTKTITFGFPLDSTTNSASRQHLKTLRPPRLNLSFDRPTEDLFAELKDLVAETTSVLGIRYVPLRRLVDASTFLCEPLQSFERIHLYLNLPRPRQILVGPEGARTLGEDPSSPVILFTTSLVSALEAADADVQKRYTVWKVDGWESAGQVKNATKTKLWPVQVLFESLDDEDGMEGADGAEAGSSKKIRHTGEEEEDDLNRRQAELAGKEKKHWDREMNFKLLGGLVNLTLESKKH